jgi:hypothetical protein
MITLTTPPQVNTILGGTSLVGYDKLVLTPMTLDPVTGTVQATVRLTSTSQPAMQPLTGRLTIASGLLTIDAAPAGFFRQVQLSVGQINSVNTIITNAQNALEAGLVSLGVVAGTQATGV